MRLALSNLGGRIALALSALVVTSCVTLISQYDEKTDEMATSIQKAIDTEFETLNAQQAPDCFYPNHKAFYQQVKIDIKTLAVRAAARQLNSLTISQIDDLRGAVENFEALHQKATGRQRCLTAEEMSPDVRGIDSTVGAILKLELAKKRGK